MFHALRYPFKSSVPKSLPGASGEPTYLRALFLEELGVYLFADDLGADVILDGDAQPHLLQDELHLLLLLHGAIGLHLARGHVKNNRTREGMKGIRSAHLHQNLKTTLTYTLGSNTIISLRLLLWFPFFSSCNNSTL